MKKEIESTINKYKDFFEKTTADVATTVKGKNYFYFVDKISGDFYSMKEFSTANELEQIILYEMSEEINTAIEVAIENINHKINIEVFKSEISYSEYSIEENLIKIEKSLAVIESEFQRWNIEVKETVSSIKEYCNKQI